MTLGHTVLISISREQVDPVYEAKGIETVRRDGCPAVAKILEKCLRIVNGRIGIFIE